MWEYGSNFHQFIDIIFPSYLLVHLCNLKKPFREPFLDQFVVLSKIYHANHS